MNEQQAERLIQSMDKLHTLVNQIETRMVEAERRNLMVANRLDERLSQMADILRNILESIPDDTNAIGGE